MAVICTVEASLPSQIGTRFVWAASVASMIEVWCLGQVRRVACEQHDAGWQAGPHGVQPGTWVPLLQACSSRPVQRPSSAVKLRFAKSFMDMFPQVWDSHKSGHKYQQAAAKYHRIYG